MNKQILSSKKDVDGKSAYDSVLEEMRVLQRLEHPNIMWLHEIIDDPAKMELYLVTEYYKGGSITQKVEEMENNKLNLEHNLTCKDENRISDMITCGLKERSARLYFIDTLKALHYCHNVIKVIHRDIKPDNIMINHNNEAVLIDFGVSALVDQQEDDKLNKNMGTFNFYAPEMFLEKSTGMKVEGKKTDMWALGVTLFYMICGQTPYEGSKTPLQLKDRIIDEPINFGLIKKDQVRDLLKLMLNKNPDERISLEDVLLNQWVI